MFRQSLRRFKRAGEIALGRGVRLAPDVTCDSILLGHGYGAWRVCPTPLGPDSVVYSFGVGDDISFDLALIERFGVELHAFDPTPRSIAWIEQQTLPDSFHFHPVGISDREEVAKLHPPARHEHVSYSVFARGVADDVVDAPMRRFETIRQELGHHEVGLLKLDVEGAEYAVIDDLVSRELPVHQLLVEFHHRWKGVSVERTRRALCALAQAGFRLFAASPSGDECSLIRTTNSEGSA